MTKILHQFLHQPHVAGCVSWIYGILVLYPVHYLEQTHHPHCQPGIRNKILMSINQSVSQSINQIIAESINRSVSR